MNKTTLLSVAAALAASAVLTDAARAAVHSRPNPANGLEQRVEHLRQAAWAVLERSGPIPSDAVARAWGNGRGRAWGNGGRAWGNGGARRGFANGGGGGFANGYRGGFANW